MAGPLAKDRVKETTTTTGTGTLTLAGVVSGFQSFSAVGNGNTCYYCIAHRTAAEWETGIGTYTSSGTTLSRDTVLASSNSGVAVSFSAGTKDVFVGLSAARGLQLAAAPAAGSLLLLDADGNVAQDNANLSWLSSLLTVGGSVSISGLARRIQADFSNSTAANRLFFQSSTVNGNTILGAMPNGTGNQSNLNLYNASDPANAGILTVVSGPTASFLNSTSAGTGTANPFELRYAGVAKALIGSYGFADKGGQVYNVKAYGATGDGTTDDLAAIHAARDAMPSGAGGLFLPTGTYRVSAPITLTSKNDLKVFGVGTSSIIAPDAGQNAFNVTTCSRLRMEDFVVVGGVIGLNINGASHSYYTRLQIQSTTGDGVFVNGNGSTELTFDNIFIYQAAGVGFHYSRTTTPDTGGMYLNKVLAIAGGTGTAGIKFDATGNVSTYLFMTDCVADGYGANPSFWLVKQYNWRVENLYATGQAIGTGAIVLDSSGQGVLTNVWAQNSYTGGTAAILEIKNGCNNISFDDLHLAGNNGASVIYAVYFTTSDNFNLRFGKILPQATTTFTNNYPHFHATAGAANQPQRLPGGIYDVRGYGAVGDGGIGFDGVMTSGLFALTCATSTPFLAADAAIVVTAAGSAGTNGTNLSISFTGGGGSGAAGLYDVVGGVVTNVRMTAAGSGYTTAPAVSFPNVANATATANLSAGTVAGRQVLVVGAASAGDNLLAGISSYFSASSVFLGTAAGTTVATATVVVYRTSDQSAFDAALADINASRGGVLRIPSGVYNAVVSFGNKWNLTVQGDGPSSILAAPANLTTGGVQLVHVEFSTKCNVRDLRLIGGNTGLFINSNLRAFCRSLLIEGQKRGTQRTVSTLTFSTTTATVTTSVAHGWATGDFVTITGATPYLYNGTWAITVTGTTTATFTLPVTPAANATGTMVAAKRADGDAIHVFGDGSTEITFNETYLHDYEGIGFHYTRTTTSDSGGMFLRGVSAAMVSGTTGIHGFKFSSSNASGTAIYLYATHIVADNFASDSGIVFQNVANFRLNSFWCSTTVAARGAVVFHNAVQGHASGGWAQNSSTTGYAAQLDATGAGTNTLLTFADNQLVGNGATSYGYGLTGTGASSSVYSTNHTVQGGALLTNSYSAWAAAGLAIELQPFTVVGGTAAVAPLKLTAGTNLTAAAAGAVEYDGNVFYNTSNTTNGRCLSDAWNYYRLTGSGTGITTIADFFGSTSAIPLVANGVYEIEWVCYFSQATAGIATWTVVTATTALANLTGTYIGSPIGGIGAVGTPQTAGINVTTSSSTAFPVTGTEATGVTHYFRVRVLLTAGNGASNVRLRLAMSAGTATPLINSHYRVRRLPGSNTGTFVA